VLAAGDVPVVEIERGGDVTYHGPGQLVAYPIVLLGEGERDLHKFLRNLEEAILETVAAMGVEGAGRKPGATGVWIGAGGRSDAEPPQRKIASIGIACRRWVTFHGLALNVTTDLSYFRRIQPCGFDPGVMTSVAAELTRGSEMTHGSVSVAAAGERLGAALARSLNRRLRAP
jgi:lipoyl(octanoyl) transferase